MVFPQGWFNISKARYSMGNKHVSALQYSSEMEPLVHVYARCFYILLGLLQCTSVMCNYVKKIQTGTQKYQSFSLQANCFLKRPPLAQDLSIEVLVLWIKHIVSLEKLCFSGSFYNYCIYIILTPIYRYNI